MLLVFWLASNIFWELHQRALEADAGVNGQVDPFNFLDLPALLLTLGGLLTNLYVTTSAELDAFAGNERSGRTWVTALMACGVLLLWMRTLRLMLVNFHWGGFVLMVFTMLVRDVFKYLTILLVFVLGFTAAAQKLFEPPPAAANDWTDERWSLFGHLGLSERSRFPEWAAESESFDSCEVLTIEPRVYH